MSESQNEYSLEWAAMDSLLGTASAVNSTLNELDTDSTGVTRVSEVLERAFPDSFRILTKALLKSEPFFTAKFRAWVEKNVPWKSVEFREIEGKDHLFFVPKAPDAKGYKTPEGYDEDTGQPTQDSW